MAENPTQDIIEVVGNTAGERPHGLEPMGLLQPRLQPRPLPLHRVPPDGIDNSVETHPQQTELAVSRNATRPADRIKTQRGDDAVCADIRNARDSPDAKGNAGIFDFSRWHTVDVWNMDDPLGVGTELSSKLRRALRPARRKGHSGPGPDVPSRRRAR